MLRNAHKIVFVLLSICISEGLQASNAITEYLNTAYHDNIQKEKEALFDAYPYKKNYIEKIRAEAEVSHFSDTERQYTLQAFPKSISEMEIEENIYHLKKSYIKNHVDNSNIIKVRYTHIIDAYYQKAYTVLVKAYVELYKKKLDIANVSNEDSADAARTMKIKNKLSSLKREYFNSQTKYQNILNTISRDSNIQEHIAALLRDDLFIDSGMILKNVKAKAEAIAYTPKERDLYKVQLLEQKVSLDERKDSWHVRSFDLKYDDSKRERNAFTLGVSLEVPLPGNKNLKHLDNRLKLIEAKEKILTGEEKTSERTYKLIDKIHFLSSYLQKLESSFIDVKKYRNFAKIDGVDPQFLLDLRKENLETAETKLKTRYKLYQAYIEFLDLNRELNRLSGENFLARKQ